MGRDSSGKWFDELYDEPWMSMYMTAYATSVARRQPSFFRGNLEFVGKEYLYFSSVHLPLASDGETVDMLLLGLDFDPPGRPTL